MARHGLYGRRPWGRLARSWRSISLVFRDPAETDGFPFSWTMLNLWLPRFPLIDVGRRRSVEAATEVHVIRQHDPQIREDAKAWLIQHWMPRMNIERCPRANDKEELSWSITLRCKRLLILPLR